MDVRFLVDDLGVVYSDKEEGEETEAVSRLKRLRKVL